MRPRISDVIFQEFRNALLQLLHFTYDYDYSLFLHKILHVFFVKGILQIALN